MGKSIFKKYFITCSLIILTSILFLGTAVTVTTVQITNAQRQMLVRQNADDIAQAISTNYQYMDTTTLSSLITIYASASDATVMVVDQNGKRIGISDTKMIFNLQSDTVPASIMKAIKSGKGYTNTGDFGGLLTTTYNVAGAPVTVSNTMIGAIFVFSRADTLALLVYYILRIFIICSLIVLLLSFVIISLVTARLVRPLREMSAAAKSFAKGDFSKRVPVYDKDEIGQLASAFNNMASSLTSLEDMRRSFVANVSHELKTPMTSIAGFVDGILDGTIPPEQQNHYLHIVSDEIKRLSRLVRSLLDIASLEAGSFTFSKTDFDAAETIRRVLIGFEKQIDHKGLSVSASGLDDALLVNADPDITHRIIYNLIDNAVKFANDNGSIEINAAPSDGRLYIGIKNTGMGIPEKDLPFVFDRFYKTDKSRGLDRNGIGLGLYIVKSTLLLMGEDIVVKSVEGQFCEFVFTLKLI